jgi:hypothetical protein
MWRVGWPRITVASMPEADFKRPFLVGEEVLVTGGYDMQPDWLAGGSGYVGTLREIDGNRAVVELDDELILTIPPARKQGWAMFGTGSGTQLERSPVARGRWLVLTQGWVGQEWSEPTARLHVGLCDQRPRLNEVPPGGGIGAWVESHAVMRHVE